MRVATPPSSRGTGAAHLGGRLHSLGRDTLPASDRQGLGEPQEQREGNGKHTHHGAPGERAGALKSRVPQPPSSDPALPRGHAMRSELLHGTLQRGRGKHQGPFLLLLLSDI